MDMGRSESGDFQLQYPKPPPTPYKTLVSDTHPIRTEMQEHKLNQADWLGSERSAPDFGQGQASMEVSSFHTEVAFTGLNRVADGLTGKGKAVVTEDRAGMCMNQSLGAMDQWDISFGDLLALAEAASKAGNAGQIGGRLGASSSACVSLPANNFAPGSNFQFHGNCTPENNGLTIPRHFTCDLNFPPGITENVVSTMSIPRFAPMTPAKPGRAEINHVSESQNLEVYGKENQEENENEVAVTGDDTNQLQGPSQPDTESSVLAVSTTEKENQDSEEGSQKLDLSKTPQQKPKKRKHRPKVVREDKPKQTPKPTVTPKSTGSKENPTGKRKYVRKAKPATTPAEVNSDSADPKTLDSQVTKNSCRRALKFGAQEQQQQDENSTQRPIADLDSESRVENTEAGIEYDLTCAEVLRDDMSLPEVSHEAPNEGKSDQVTVHGDIAKTTMKNNNTRSASRSPNGSTCCTSAVLTEEVPTRRSKRNCSRVIEEASNTNRNGVQFNNLQFYASLLHFPNIYKKRRSEKGQNSVTSSTSSCWNSASQLTTSGAPDKLESGGSQQDQTIKYLPPFTHQVKVTKKRSRAVTRVRDLASLNKLAECEMQTTYSAQRTKNSEQPHTCIEALVANMQPTLAKRKRSKMRNYTSGLASTYSNKMVLYKHHQSFAESSGRRPKVMSWPDHVDAVTEQFKYLDINREGRTRRAIYQEMNRLVPYNQDQNALVLYRSNGTIVPFQGAFSPIKKRRERPKVELDDETNKVWRLLLENINNEGIDGTDEEKRRWWEEERRVFRGRADSFIARMHLVQGDRRFSRWKGSVVDSVIGVFLTQNVSDHLSSSAFMSLAARYPLKSEISDDPLEEEDATLSVKEPEVCVLDSEQTIEWKKKIPTQRDCDQSSVTLPDNEQNEEKEVVNSIVSPGINIVTTSLVDTAKCSALNFAESELEIYHDSTTGRETESSALNGGATNDVVSSQNSVNSSQNTVESSVAQTNNRIIAYSGTNSEADLQNRLQPTFTQLLKMAGSSMLHEVSSQRNEIVLCGENSKDAHSTSEQSILTAESASQGTAQEPLTVQESSTSCSENNQLSNLQGDENVIIQSKNWLVGDNNAESLDQEQNKKVQQTLTLPNLSGETLDVTESAISATDSQRETMQKAAKDKALKAINAAKQKSRRVGREIRNEFDWDTLRREAEPNGKKRDKTESTMDSLDWEAVRCADVNEIADTIKERGMNNMLAERIKAFLNRLVKDHGSIDLEWLRDVSPDKAKEYLLSIRGLGLKSVECVRLLTLHHLAFPVDTNVGRIAVRLGWVPLQPLPESLQLHLLELYPVLESIQKYLWPRLCKLEQKQLYELHYQMITFGKVFCTKSKPNCNACPMRGECRHFASAFASARLALPAPEEKGIVPATEKTANLDNDVHINRLPLPPPQTIQQLEGSMQLEVNLKIDEKPVAGVCEPIIEEPASPEPDNTQDLEHDIEDVLYDDPDEIPTIKLNIAEFTQNLQNYMEKNMELQEGEMSKALVALTPEVASLPVPKLKNVSRLRTEHQVYELPDSHPLLEGMDKREPDDPCSYLLAIWTPGETANSIQPPEGGCCYQESGKLCDQKTCFACNTTREANSQMVRGTLLIPCRTAMRGSFPLNGTYFQVNEVFADHDSSLNPIDVPRSWLWNLPRRTVYFGTSVPSIFKGLPTEGIQHCFWRGYVCVRGFDQKTRAPRPLMARLHFPASKLTKSRGKTVDE